MPKRREQVDMSVFRNAVEDCLDYKPEPTKGSGNLNPSRAAAEPDVEKFSGLRIRWLHCLNVLLDFLVRACMFLHFRHFLARIQYLLLEVLLDFTLCSSSFTPEIFAKFSTAMLE